MPDVIVIGGGVIGTTAAWQIAASGGEVVLLERGALASGATGRSQGLVLPPDHAEMIPLWRRSVELYGLLADRRDFGFDREPVGTLLLASARSSSRRSTTCRTPASGSTRRASPKRSRRSRRAWRAGS